MESTPTYEPAAGADLAPAGRFARGALRLATGAACIYAFGLACGASDLSVHTFGRAVGVVSTPVLFAIFFAPSLWVALTLFDLPFAAADVADSAVLGVESMGAMLGGLVPAALFFELTSGGRDGSIVAMVLEMVAFGFAGLVGLARFRTRLQGDSSAPSLANLIVFAFFAIAVVFGVACGPSAFLALHPRAA